MSKRLNCFVVCLEVAFTKSRFNCSRHVLYICFVYICFVFVHCILTPFFPFLVLSIFVPLIYYDRLSYDIVEGGVAGGSDQGRHQVRVSKPLRPHDPENKVNTLLSVRGTCKVLLDASNCLEVYQACRVEELPNLAVSPLEVSRLVCSLFMHRNPDVLFLWGIRVMYLFCMLGLLASPHLESAKID